MSPFIKNTDRDLSLVTRYSLLVTHRGFTLLELIIAIFIISLVLALSLPSFTGIGESRIKSDAKRLGSIVRYLNDSAISTKDNLQLKIDFGDKLVNYDGPEGEKSEKFDSISSIELQSRGVISEGEVIIFFGPLGALESFKIYLKDGNSGMEISLNSVSGKVKIVTSNENK